VRRRSQMMQFFTQLPPCLIGMEACGGGIFGPAKLTGWSPVKLMAPPVRQAYVKTKKNDARERRRSAKR